MDIAYFVGIDFMIKLTQELQPTYIFLVAAVVIVSRAIRPKHPGRGRFASLIYVAQENVMKICVSAGLCTQKDWPILLSPLHSPSNLRNMAQLQLFWNILLYVYIFNMII